MTITNQDKIRVTLPAIIVRGVVPLPHSDVRLELTDAQNQAAVAESMKQATDRYIVVLINKSQAADKQTINEIGLVAKSVYMMRSSSDTYKYKFTGITRAKIVRVVGDDPYVTVEIETLPAIDDDSAEEVAALRLLMRNLKSSKKKNLSDELAEGLRNPEASGDEIADIVASALDLDVTLKLRYLNEPEALKRLKFLLADLQREKTYQTIEEQLESEVMRSLSESQKEYYLREKMRIILEELGDKAVQESDVDALREKILASGMPKQIEEKALKELKRYASMSPMAAESSVARTYLEFMVDLPWKKESEDCNDIKKAKAQLDKDHFGLDKVKERILEYLAVKIMTGKNPQTILCLVGPPGVGKTSLAASIAKALNKKFVKQSLGGVDDESEIRGHRRTYVGALPGRILQGMKRAGTTNPVFLLDEIDKLSRNFRGDPSSALLEVLDPAQNSAFSDHYLEEPYDLSQVFFITTANYLGNIQPTLRDRLEIVELSSYTVFEKLEIAKRHLLRRQLSEHGLDKEKFSINDAALIRIINEYTMEAGVRQLDRTLGTLVRKAIKQILAGETDKAKITKTNLEEWLGKPKYFFNKIDKKDQVGIVTGLAYTEFGGDTLQVEVTTYPGSGEFLLTGQLGDVMKESAQTAISYVRSHAKEWGIAEDFFKKNDVHIHVPEGAIPKDGPSAGVTMATAVASALAGKPVNHLLAMTGEITLRGRVLPIGGLREKAIAANRSGIKKILIPKDNQNAIEDIPESVKEALEIVLVSTIEEVFTEAFKLEK